MHDATAALAYHERTKHHFHRFARSLGYLDWANQPDPFRRFEGAPLVRLPLRAEQDSPPYDAIYDRAALRAAGPVAAFGLDFVSELFFRSLALSAWKQLGTARWALRCNPSSGNLHPTEGYLVAGATTGLAAHAGVWHYAPMEHGLELRARLEEPVFAKLMRGFPQHAMLVGLSSVHWREAWKYGERAYRYCQHDAGHAIAAVSLAAASLGWQAHWLDGLGDADVATCLGLDRDADFAQVIEREHPDVLLAVYPGRGDGEGSVPREVARAALEGVRGAAWGGIANVLSRDHVDWEVIEATARACRKPRGLGQEGVTVVSHLSRGTHRAEREHSAGKVKNDSDTLLSGADILLSRGLFRQRRSAVAMDGVTSIDADTFARMLERALPVPGRPPFDVLHEDPAVTLALFVHRVEGLPAGIYALARRDAHVAMMREAMREEFLWEHAPAVPATLPLFLLVPIDCRDAATRVSCDQNIAGDGAFSLGMLAELEPRLRAHGSWYYRRLFWECGMIGQVLYLEAEAAGIRSTGIGCYYDDPVHDLLGLRGHAWQSLYHFTVGGAVDDPRLTTLPAYPELAR